MDTPENNIICAVGVTIFGNEEVTELLEKIKQATETIQDCAWKLRTFGIELRPMQKKEADSSN